MPQRLGYPANCCVKGCVYVMILQKEHFTADCRILTMWYSSPTTTHSLRCSQSKQSAASFLGFVSPSSDHRGSRGRSRDLTRESKKLEEIVRKKSFLTDVRSGPSYPAVVTQLYFYSPHTKDKSNNVIKYCIYDSFSDVGEIRVYFASKILTPCRMH